MIVGILFRTHTLLFFLYIKCLIKSESFLKCCRYEANYKKEPERDEQSSEGSFLWFNEVDVVFLETF